MMWRAAVCVLWSLLVLGVMADHPHTYASAGVELDDSDLMHEHLDASKDGELDALMHKQIDALMQQQLDALAASVQKQIDAQFAANPALRGFRSPPPSQERVEELAEERVAKVERVSKQLEAFRKALTTAPDSHKAIAAMIAEQSGAIMADPKSRDQLKAFKEQLKGEANLQQQLKNMMTDPSVQKLAALLRQRKDVMLADPDVQRQEALLQEALLQEESGPRTVSYFV